MIYVIESPFAASAERTQEEHRIHALKLCRAVALAHPGALVYASHAYVPSFLNEADPIERDMGIGMQKAMIRFAANFQGEMLVWDDWKISTGMKAGIAVMSKVRISYHTRGEVPEWDHLDKIVLPEGKP